jgi:hypothetical protein
MILKMWALAQPRRSRTLLILFALVAAVVLAKCGTSGTYQGGGDSTPYYR